MSPDASGMDETAEAGRRGTPAETPQRVFLVLVDETQEMANALRFACRRAQHTHGRVALLYVIQPVEFQHWLGVGRILEQDARAAAEQQLQTLAARVFEQTGTMPAVHIREGSRAEELVRLVAEDPSISLVVLGTASGSSNLGPVVSYLLANLRKLRVPVTLVPGELTPEQIDMVT